MQNLSSPNYPEHLPKLRWAAFASDMQDGTNTTAFTAEVAEGTLHRVLQVGPGDQAHIAVDLVPHEDPGGGDTLYNTKIDLTGLETAARRDLVARALRTAELDTAHALARLRRPDYVATEQTERRAKAA